MDRWFDIPWVGDKILSIGDQNTMDRGSIFHGYWGSKYHGLGCHNTMDGFDIPWIGESICHG
jgi:hypothetical protein